LIDQRAGGGFAAPPTLLAPSGCFTRVPGADELGEVRSGLLDELDWPQPPPIAAIERPTSSGASACTRIEDLLRKVLQRADAAPGAALTLRSPGPHFQGAADKYSGNIRWIAAATGPLCVL
jgi:hypothetical protein